MKVVKIISGGQTGTDQAALQAAIDKGIEHGGWCPPGRLAENGEIPQSYDLKETPEDRHSYAPRIPCSQRTIWNVRDADALLVFLPQNKFDVGTQLSIHVSKKIKKEYFIIDPDNEHAREDIRKWLDTIEGEVLNVSGPSENKFPGIYKKVYKLISEL